MPSLVPSVDAVVFFMFFSHLQPKRYIQIVYMQPVRCIYCLWSSIYLTWFATTNPLSLREQFLAEARQL